MTAAITLLERAAVYWKRPDCPMTEAGIKQVILLKSGAWNEQ